MSRLRASSGRGASQLSGDAMRESLSLFLQLEGSASEEGDPEEVHHEIWEYNQSTSKVHAEVLRNIIVRYAGLYCQNDILTCQQLV